MEETPVNRPTGAAEPAVAELVPPNPSDLIESIRGFGYSLPSALADLIDNSLTAGARNIEVVVDLLGDRPHLVVLDDGVGMTVDRTIEAMRMGSMGPLSARDEADLGRFGLGLKTASFSQGRSLTLATKAADAEAVTLRRWDLDHVREVSAWQLLAEPSIEAVPWLTRLRRMDQGTLVVVGALDRAALNDVAKEKQSSQYAKTLEEVRQHLSMVFHRFIEDGIVIRLGGAKVPDWDPFLTRHSRPSKRETLRSRSGLAEIQPWVLPHHSKLTFEEHAAAAGPRGWNKHQGFYIYRGRRLIVPGTWLGLGIKQEEHSKLARIRIDLPNTVDGDWQLNVMKSNVSVPPALRDDLRRIADSVRREAVNVYRTRGERAANNGDLSKEMPRALWRRSSAGNGHGVRFGIDRGHPLVKELLVHGCESPRMFQDVLTLIEEALPIAAILQESEKSLGGLPVGEPPMDLDKLAEIAAHIVGIRTRSGAKVGDATAAVFACEPFLSWRVQLLEKLSGNSARTSQDPEDG